MLNFGAFSECQYGLSEGAKRKNTQAKLVIQENVRNQGKTQQFGLDPVPVENNVFAQIARGFKGNSDLKMMFLN